MINCYYLMPGTAQEISTKIIYESTLTNEIVKFSVRPIDDFLVSTRQTRTRWNLNFHAVVMQLGVLEKINYPKTLISERIILLIQKGHIVSYTIFNFQTQRFQNGKTFENKSRATNSITINGCIFIISILLAALLVYN